MDVFKILQLTANDFRVRKNGGKEQHYKKLKQFRYHLHIFQNTIPTDSFHI